MSSLEAHGKPDGSNVRFLIISRQIDWIRWIVLYPLIRMVRILRQIRWIKRIGRSIDRRIIRYM